METVQRFDFVPLGKSRKTPQGFLIFDANLTRTGVLEYRRADGSIQRELRHPDEVFKADSLATLGNAPVTDQHKAMISPQNATGLAVGITSEKVDHDSKFVTGRVTVWDQNMIDLINKKERRELSPGYRCRMDYTPGEYNGQKYDAIQRDIVYNHVGIGPSGWGRSGSEVALKLDGEDAASDITNDTAGQKPPSKRETPKMKVRIDGVEYEVGTDSWLQAVEKQQARIDAELKDLSSKLEKSEARADAAEAKAKDLEKKLEEANDPKRFDAAIEERADLYSKARSVLGEEVDLSGKSPRDIKVAVVGALRESLKLDGKSDDYVDASYDACMADYKPEDKRSDGNAFAQFLTPSRGKPEGGKGDADKYDSRSAYQRMIERNQNAWKDSDEQGAN